MYAGEQCCQIGWPKPDFIDSLIIRFSWIKMRPVPLIQIFFVRFRSSDV